MRADISQVGPQMSQKFCSSSERMQKLLLVLLQDRDIRTVEKIDEFHLVATDKIF